LGVIARAALLATSLGAGLRARLFECILNPKQRDAVRSVLPRQLTAHEKADLVSFSSAL
jgi:hypothetical protein